MPQSKPDLVNVDGDKVLLALKTDNKTLDEYVFQYFNAPLFMDRFDAIENAQLKQNEEGGRKILIAALQDKYYGLRVKAANALSMKNNDINGAATPILISLAKTDDNTLARAAALNALARAKSPANMDLFKNAINSQSYAVQAAALNGINRLDPAQALLIAKGLEKDNIGDLTQAIIAVYAQNGNSAQWPFVYKQYMEAERHQQVRLIKLFAQMTGRVDNSAYAKQGIDAIKKLGHFLQQDQRRRYCFDCQFTQ